MKKIVVKDFLRIWDKIATFEHVSDRELCKILGLSPLTATYWRTGKTKTIRARHLRAIQEKLGYRIDSRPDGSLALVTSGVEEVRNNRAKQQLFRELGKNTKEETYFMAPLAVVRQTDESVEIAGRGIFSPFEQSDLAGSMWYRVEDDAMKPMFSKGDYLLLSKQETQITSGLALVIMKGDAKPPLCRVLLRAGEIEFLGSDGRHRSDILDGSDIAANYLVLCAVYSSQKIVSAKAVNRVSHSGGDNTSGATCRKMIS